MTRNECDARKTARRERRQRELSLPALTTLLVLVHATLLGIGCAASVPSPPPPVADEGSPVSTAPLLLDAFRAAREAAGDRSFVAGAAKVDLTPRDRDVWIAGFGQMRRSKGVLDPIHGRALFLDDGESHVVFVSLDFVGFTLSSVERVRALVTDGDRRRIILCATHNHEGPDTMGYWGPGLFVPVVSGVDTEYLAWVERRVAGCINEAVAAARPARLVFGEATAPGGISANLWYEGDPTKKHDGIAVMRVEADAGRDEPGETLATVVNFDMHAEALFGKNRLLSADWPGRLCRDLERKTGGVALYFAGAVGGMIIPYPNLFSVRGDWTITERVRWIESVGEILSEKAMEAVSGDRPRHGDGEIRIDVRQTVVPLPVENRLFRLVARLGIVDWRERGFDASGRVPVEVSLVDLGPAQFVTVPGEIFWSMGAYFRAIMDGPHRFILGLADDEVGYIMSESEFEDPTYKYERSMSMGRETGTLIMEAVEQLLGVSAEGRAAGYPSVQ